MGYPNLTPGTLDLLADLWWNSGRDRVVHSTGPRLAAHARAHVSTVNRRLQALAKAGLIEVLARPAGGSPGRYRVTDAGEALLRALDGEREPVAYSVDGGQELLRPGVGPLVITGGHWNVHHRGPTMALEVYGDAEVMVSGDVATFAYEHSRVISGASTAVTARQCAFIETRGAAPANLYDHAVGVAGATSTMAAYDQATVYATDRSTVHAYGQATVHATDYTHVAASERVLVYASVHATVEAAGSAAVQGSGYAQVIAGPGAVASAGTILHEESLKDPREALYRMGVDTSSGTVRLYKTLPADCVSGRDYGKPTRWEVGKTVECDEWDPGASEGNGLYLHGTIAHAFAFVESADDVVAEVAVDLADLDVYSHGGLRARRARVLRFVGRGVY